MELLIKGDEIGYISQEDDQSFGFFCPVVQIYNDAIAAQLVDAWNRRASPASALEGFVLVPVEIINRFQELNPSNYDHDDVCELIAWAVELVLAAAPTPPSTEDRKDAELYGELLYAVANKFPGESRHQTALRYIRNAEKRSDNATTQEDKP